MRFPLYLSRNFLAGFLAMLAVTPLWALDLDGRLDWAGQATLGTLVSGRIEQVPVRPGDRVEQGQLLLALDGRAFQSRIAEARAELNQAEVRLAEAQREDDRSTELYDRTLISDHERELARIGLAEAQAAAQIARARLQQARLDLEYSRIESPFAAWVLAVKGVPGQVVVSELQSPALVTVARAGLMQANAELAADALASLGADEDLRVAVGGDWYPARLVVIGMEPVREDGRNLYYPLQVEFDVPADKPLRAGQPVRIRIGN